MKVREPVARPSDVIAAELLLSGSQAFLVGMLAYLAVGIWDERSVAGGPVAVILALLALAVGAGWLYWLLGGAGWPLAGANVPVAVFVAAALVLGLGGGHLLAFEPLPLLLMLMASGYGVVAGAFLDPPRRWRWDQRQRPRQMTEPPRLSEPTRAVLRALTRRRSRRAGGPYRLPATSEPMRAAGPPEASSDTASRAPSPAAPASARPSGERPSPRRPSSGRPSRERPAPSRPGTRAPASTRPSPAPLASPAPERPAPAPPVVGLAPDPLSSKPGMEDLPTSVEPRAQRSPWAWARPPEWNRDEDDEPDGGGRS